jgi:hypothetical protein
MREISGKHYRPTLATQGTKSSLALGGQAESTLLAKASFVTYNSSQIDTIFAI